MQLNTAKQIASERQRVMTRKAELKQEIERAEYNHPDRVLDRLRRELRDIELIDLPEIVNAEHALVRQSQPSPREAELCELITRNMRDEQYAMRDRGYLCDRHIRADAVAKWQAEIADREQQIQKLLENTVGAHVRPDPTGRIIGRKMKLEREINELKRDEKLYVAGQEVYRLREERKRLNAEVIELREQHRRDALAV